MSFRLLVLVSPIFSKLAVATSVFALVSACAPGPAPVSASPRDPSSPSAPEAVTTTATTMPAQPAESATDHAGHGHSHGQPASSAEGGGNVSTDGGAQGVVYVCPMHPEVTSNAPGSCPKCHMKLVPKK